MNNIRAIFLILAVLISGCSGNNRVQDHHKFVSTDWLQEHLYDSSLVILHIGKKNTFDSIHIPNSQYVPLRGFMINTDSLRHEFQEINKIDSILISTGINDQSLIVLYYENEMMIPGAARLFLTLDYAGLGDKTFVLNGGLVKWLKEGKTMTDSIYTKPHGNLNLAKNRNFLVNAYDVEDYMEKPEYVILDARPADYYTGQFDSIEQKYVGGHIERC